MNEEYKQIECISKMKKEYFDKFCTIVEGYREKISDNLVIGDSAFTLHDLTTHLVVEHLTLPSIEKLIWDRIKIAEEVRKELE